MNLISFALLIAFDNVELEKEIGWMACNHIFIIERVICAVLCCIGRTKENVFTLV